MNEQQERVIRENLHVHPGKLAKLLNLKLHEVANQRRGKRTWSYTGVGIPFLSFNSSRGAYTVAYQNSYIFSGNAKKAIDIVDHLVWCIESNMFKQPRIEHPYFENLKLGE